LAKNNPSFLKSLPYRVSKAEYRNNVTLRLAVPTLSLIRRVKLTLLANPSKGIAPFKGVSAICLTQNEISKQRERLSFFLMKKNNLSSSSNKFFIFSCEILT